MARIKHYESDGIRVSYDSQRCIHAAECVHGLPGVFDPKRRPWVDPSAAAADEVADVVGRCPTGALQFERLDGGGDEVPPEANRLFVSPDGPVYATGDLMLLDSERRPLRHEFRAALCRCGASQNKPFCDGRHADAEFQNAGELGTSRMREIAEDSDSCLSIRLRENGPLVLEGRFTIAGADGSRAEGAAAALCRCGASHNKPFCDGTHRDVDFQADDPNAGDAT